jgi:hypothetical protein
MKKLISFCMVLLLLSMSGCSLLASKENFSSEINDLRVQQNYGDALSKIKRKMLFDQKYTLLYEQVMLEAKRYEKTNIDKSRSELKRNELYPAFKILDSASGNFPQGELLKDELALVLKQRDALLQAKKDEQLLSYAQYLKDSLEGYKQIAPWSDSSKDLSRYYSHIDREAKKVALSLVERGKEKEKEAGFQHQEVSTYFKLAVALSDAESIKKAHQAFVVKEGLIKARLANNREKEKQLQMQQKARQLDENTIIFRQYIKEHNFIEAKKMLDQHVFSTNAPLNEELKTLYGSTLDSEVQKSYRMGTQHYSSERYQLALDAWMVTLELDPTHELARKNVSRVKQILNRLENLRDKADDL